MNFLRMTPVAIAGMLLFSPAAQADDVATRAVQAAEGLTDLERATRDLEQVANMLRDLTRGFANVN